MTPVYVNSSSSDQYNEHQFFSPRDDYNEQQFSSPNSQASLSSHSLTCDFFNPITTHDQDEDFNRESRDPSQNEDNNFGSQACDEHCVGNQDDQRGGSNGGLQFSLWKREIHGHVNNQNQVKWMSSKMRVMLKMKKTDPTKTNTSRSTAIELLRHEDHHDHKEPISSPMEETANSINSTSFNNSPIRVCSDCNTTKTPLWRSGPQGPKSLCNACGIRQRKARKAMAAAAEASKSVYNERPTSLKATKILHKDLKKPSKHFTKYKNRLCSKQINMRPSPSSLFPERKNSVEEFLGSLSKNLAYYRVFPQDEKEAAILLMALSCGYVHQ